MSRKGGRGKDRREGYHFSQCLWLAPCIPFLDELGKYIPYDQSKGLPNIFTSPQEALRSSVELPPGRGKAMSMVIWLYFIVYVALGVSDSLEHRHLGSQVGTLGDAYAFNLMPFFPPNPRFWVNLTRLHGRKGEGGRGGGGTCHTKTQFVTRRNI
ncbi:hypothetical protein B0F90DRAFT_1356472 [Multifurca ochricompacta]|uniref:Uncharacterized protein n=1 Tax=Multifurca ochricompacta TaxID=376703 RepID=A0AAD4M5Q4_9AGAM|nr:hypothetical protein B0F90DRAFT_1356472 [Multifurca ochricompacta]